jgi:hypothetical protein
MGLRPRYESTKPLVDQVNLIAGAEPLDLYSKGVKSTLVSC